MTVQDKAEEAVEKTMDMYDEMKADKGLIVENATETAMANLDDDEWSGDEDQWDEMYGIVGRIYDRRISNA